jgi:hypothetical protein
VEVGGGRWEVEVEVASASGAGIGVDEGETPSGGGAVGAAPTARWSASQMWNEEGRGRGM